MKPDAAPEGLSPPPELFDDTFSDAHGDRGPFNRA